MMSACGSDERMESVTQNPAVRLGAALGELARLGCDKATLIASPTVCTFGDWAEQLVARAPGKKGAELYRWLAERWGNRKYMERTASSFICGLQTTRSWMVRCWRLRAPATGDAD